MNALEAYLRSLDEDHASGEAVAETSGYGALQNLLNAAGEGLSPRVRAIINTRNRGAGIPDGGLFTADQFGRERGSGPQPGQLPERGAIEVKGPGDEVREIASGEQVGRYLERYGQVLVTNYREFLLVERGPSGKPVEIESYSLAGSKEEFWEAAAGYRRTAAVYSEGLENYLKRAMLRGAPLGRPRDLAWFLASYARDALAIVERAELPTLSQVRDALEQALGLEFEGERGEHFFRSTLIQTLFYGVFSAWVLWSKQRSPASPELFDWRVAAFDLNVPMIRAFFEQLVMPSRVKALGLGSILDRTGETLNRVDRAVFFENFDEDGAVQYFYEPFLEAFDPELRKELGVWYTPRELVHYMVERVDAVLREELGLPDGLADESVYVLDPCTGTGSYLVEVLKRVRRTFEEKGEDALAAQDLKRAATERVFGFELLPAPFVVAHLQLGLLLQDLGAPLSDEGDERVGVYLTNALTGWQTSATSKEPLPLPEFQEEREAAEEVKRKRPILVVLGNPPYNGYAGVGVDEERDLSNAYRTTKRAPAPRGQGLNDLYVRFFRMAERQIVEGTKRGVVCFISNYSWLEHLSFPGMRERYLGSFDKIWIDCLNGDKYRTGKLTPERRADPSVFSTESNPEGIQVGTAVALLVRKERHEGAETVRFRHLWGREKRALLVETAEQDGESLYEKQTPPLELGLPFAPLQTQAEYPSWPLPPELLPESFPGVKTSRDDVLVDIERDRLVARMEAYFDPERTDDEVSRTAPSLMKDTSGFDAKSTRDRLLRRGFLPKNVVGYAYRPFDMRWLYWEPETKLLDRKREKYFPQVFDGNAFLFTTGRVRKSKAEPALSTHLLCDLNYMDSGARGFPLYLRPTERQLLQEGDPEALVPNLTEPAAEYVVSLGTDEKELFYHCLAILHSLAYRWENNDSLRLDWPRIPLPGDQEALLASADLGRRVAALLDTEGVVGGITSGKIRPEFRVIAQPLREDGDSLDPGAGDLRVTAGWGYRQNRTVMAGQGRGFEREYTLEERAAIEQGAEALGIPIEQAFARLGETTFDLYLNEAAYWANVPSKVWSYTMGGYPVIKKWLSYREEEILGRSLSVGEVRQARDIARRIAGLLLLEQQLDDNYETIKASWRAQNKP